MLKMYKKITMKTINNNRNDKNLFYFPPFLFTSSFQVSFFFSSIIFYFLHFQDTLSPSLSLSLLSLSLSLSLSWVTSFILGALSSKKDFSCVLYSKTNLLGHLHPPLGHLSSLHLAPNKKKTLVKAKTRG